MKNLPFSLLLCVCLYLTFTFFFFISLPLPLLYHPFQSENLDDLGEAISEKTSNVTLIDLAGSERADSSDTNGERLKVPWTAFVIDGTSCFSEVHFVLAESLDGARIKLQVDSYYKMRRRFSYLGIRQNKQLGRFS